MKKVTLRAEEHWIEQARLVARSQHKTLNAAFREWLEQYVSGAASAKEVDALMKRLRHVKAGRTFTRDEMNAR
jgi:N-glycosylase/DNA lyase